MPLGGRPIAGGLFWQFKDQGNTAVSVFFVLSGYVIAHVLSTHERSALDYISSRLGRLYSVLLPALLLGFLCDLAGLQKDPSLYHQGLFGTGDHFDELPVRYLATLLFLNRAWVFHGLNGLEPGTNGPLWSLSYEAFYYLAIAIFVFVRGGGKWAILALVAIIAGPTVILLAPTWLLGFYVYHFDSRHLSKKSIAFALWILSAATCLISYRLAFVRSVWDIPELAPAFGNVESSNAHYQLGDLLSRYAAAISFAINILSFRALSADADQALSKFSVIIRWAGSLTFALYVFHMPLIFLLSAYRLGPPISFAQRAWLIGGVLFIVVTIGRYCELNKARYKKFFNSIFNPSIFEKEKS